MKKTKEVTAAEEAANKKAAELAAARETVKRLEREHAESIAAVRKAHEDADALLPQCRMVIVHWRSGQEHDIGRVVILRKTPSGIVVVRRVGNPSDATYKFKWREHSSRYEQVEKNSWFSYNRRELRDVPSDYLPVAHAA